MKLAAIGLLGVLLTVGIMAQQPVTNYDESQVPAFTLPDVLVTTGGARVTDAAGWTPRRAEIRALLETQMFGKAPGKPVDLAFTVESIDRAALGGTAVRKMVSLRTAGRTLSLLLYLPARPPRPVPVFVVLGFQPNQSVHSDPGIPLAGVWTQDKTTGAVSLQPAPDASRGSAASRWPVETILARGYGLATVYYGDIEPDFPNAIAQSVRAAYLKPGQRAPAADEWGAIAAWAWGLSRVADYLAQDGDVDARRLALVGHSRLGKTALWAGATDTRFALVVSNDSGEGGAAISRRLFGETVANLNERFPHWFCDNYKQYSGREGQMPFDAHMLLALAAPRPLYVASAVEDRWADPKGEFLGAVEASRVYAVLGLKGIGTADLPAVDRPVGERVRYHVRTGKHDITAYDWAQYLDFADRQMRASR